MLENYKGTIEVNGYVVDRLNLSALSKSGSSINIRLTPHNFIQQFHPKAQVNVNNGDNEPLTDDTEYRITVKAYMTRKATPEFDFMAKMNSDIPMPLRTMVGKKIRETKGMEYWELHGEGRAVITCMCCGKELTNPISRRYGVGPVCLSKMGIVADIEDVEGITEQLVKKTWSGWIVKSSIIEREEVK